MDKIEDKNEKIQNRREFFKAAATRVLPLIGAVALISNPVIAKAVEADITECKSCTNTCKGSCDKTCKNTCIGSCSGGCQKTCTNTCIGGCGNACKDSCKYQSKTK